MSSHRSFHSAINQPKTPSADQSQPVSDSREERFEAVAHTTPELSNHHPSNHHYKPTTKTREHDQQAAFFPPSHHSNLTQDRRGPYGNGFWNSTSPPPKIHGPNHDLIADAHAMAMEALHNPVQRDKRARDEDELRALARRPLPKRPPPPPTRLPSWQHKDILPLSQEHFPPLARTESTTPSITHPMARPRTTKPGTLVIYETLDDFEREQERKKKAARNLSNSPDCISQTLGRTPSDETIRGLSPQTPIHSDSEQIQAQQALFAANAFKNGSLTHPKVQQTKTPLRPSYAQALSGTRRKHSLDATIKPGPSTVPHSLNPITQPSWQHIAEEDPNRDPTYTAHPDLDLDLDLHAAIMASNTVPPTQANSRYISLQIQVAELASRASGNLQIASGRDTVIGRPWSAAPSRQAPIPSFLTERNLAVHTYRTSPHCISGPKEPCRLLSREEISRLERWMKGAEGGGGYTPLRRCT